ncbi:MAG: hypothetical protein IJ766_07310 [Clostridia bacterium]|nr:hypothetical protein [Clostridia bacterium]
MENKIYLTFQQGELDAVLMYKSLAEGACTAQEKETLLRLGAMEGRHAGILRGITGVTDLKPRDTLAKTIMTAEGVVGRRALYLFMAAGETVLGAAYKPLVKKHGELAQVEKEEYEHSRALIGMMKALGDAANRLPLYKLRRA